MFIMMSKPVKKFYYTLVRDGENQMDTGKLMIIIFGQYPTNPSAQKAVAAALDVWKEDPETHSIYCARAYSMKEEGGKPEIVCDTSESIMRSEPEENATQPTPPVLVVQTNVEELEDIAKFIQSRVKKNFGCDTDRILFAL